jgi:hypothetical protein
MKNQFPVTMVVVMLSAVAVVQASPDEVLVPQVTGTVRSLPELGILERAPVNNFIQSYYFRTTSLNREFRRGFMEFQVPAFGAPVRSAMLILSEGGGGSSSPVPPVVHELSFYPADLVVSVDDYDRPTTPVATLETHANVENEIWPFDVTALVRQFQGGALGFRVKLAVDPAYEEFAQFGQGFGGPCCVFPRIEVTFGENEIVVPFDIRPKSCPNVLNVESNGVLPAAILGTADFNVLDVDRSSIRLLGVAPLRTEFEDVGAPSPSPTEEECTVEPPDGLLDLVLQFDTRQIVEAVVTALGREPEDHEVVTLRLDGRLADGTPLTGEDTVIVLRRGGLAGLQQVNTRSAPRGAVRAGDGLAATHRH